MRHGICMTVLLLLVIMIAGSLALPGCRGDTSQLGSLDLFSRARGNLRQVGSYKMDSRFNFRYYSIPEEDPFSPNRESMLPFETYYEAVGEGGPTTKTIMDGEQAMAFAEIFPGYLDRVPVKAGPYVEYAANGVIYYQENDTGRWISIPGNTAGYFNELNAFLTPQALEYYMKSASKIEVVEETGDSIRYEFSMDPKKYLRDSDYLSWRRQAEKMGLKGDSIDHFIEQCETIVASGEYHAVVEKDTGLVSSFGWRTDNSIYDTIGLERVSNDYDSRIELCFDADFSSYGEDFSLELPNEASGLTE
jgi:hypothetical protein